MNCSHLSQSNTSSHALAFVRFQSNLSSDRIQHHMLSILPGPSTPSFHVSSHCFLFTITLHSFISIKVCILINMYTDIHHFKLLNSLNKSCIDDQDGASIYYKNHIHHPLLRERMNDNTCM